VGDIWWLWQVVLTGDTNRCETYLVILTGNINRCGTCLVILIGNINRCETHLVILTGNINRCETCLVILTGNINRCETCLVILIGNINRCETLLMILIGNINRFEPYVVILTGNISRFETYLVILTLSVPYTNDEHVGSVKWNFTKARGITQTQLVTNCNTNCKIRRFKYSAGSALSLHRWNDRESVYNYTGLSAHITTVCFWHDSPPGGPVPPHSRGS
jgi:hypothetical protein